MMILYRKNYIVFILLSCCIILSQCMSHKNIIYNYADGNGNTYTVSNTIIEYKPITPEMSSSGIYSGGNYIKKSLSSGEYNKIISSINKGVKNKAVHIKERIKGSGLIIITNNSKQIYILEPNSSEQRDIESLLQGIIK